MIEQNRLNGRVESSDLAATKSASKPVDIRQDVPYTPHSCCYVAITRILSKDAIFDKHDGNRLSGIRNLRCCLERLWGSPSQSTVERNRIELQTISHIFVLRREMFDISSYVSKHKLMGVRKHICPNIAHRNFIIIPKWFNGIYIIQIVKTC